VNATVGVLKFYCGLFKVITILFPFLNWESAKRYISKITAILENLTTCGYHGNKSKPRRNRSNLASPQRLLLRSEHFILTEQDLGKAPLIEIARVEILKPSPVAPLPPLESCRPSVGQGSSYV
jgi:hypothetical protein